METTIRSKDPFPVCAFVYILEVETKLWEIKIPKTTTKTKAKIMFSTGREVVLFGWRIDA